MNLRYFYLGDPGEKGDGKSKYLLEYPTMFTITDSSRIDDSVIAGSVW